MHDTVKQISLGRLPTVRATSMKQDLPKRQFAQDMLRINVEKDYALHDIHRQEAIFRRRYCHLISRVESLGRPQAYQGRRLSTAVPRQTRRTSDPGSRIQSKVCQTREQPWARKTNECTARRHRATSLPDIRSCVAQTPENKHSNKCSKLPAGNTAHNTKDKVDLVDTESQFISKGKRVSISNIISICSPFSDIMPLTAPNCSRPESDSKEIANQNHDDDTTESKNKRPYTNSVVPSTGHDVDVLDLSMLDIGGKSGCDNIPSDETTLPDIEKQSIDQSVSAISVRRESTTHNKVFVDYGSTTIDKIFNALFDPEFDQGTEESVNGSDDPASDPRQKMEDFQEAKRQNHFIGSRIVDNSIETLHKCRYLRLPAHRFRNNNRTEEMSRIWRF